MWIEIGEVQCGLTGEFADDGRLYNHVFLSIVKRWSR